MQRKILAVWVGLGLAFSAVGQHHSADTSDDWQLSLGEVLRVVQLYNSGFFSCDGSTEDGFQPSPAGVLSCAPHATDYLPQDWRINLSELLRLLQLYNAGLYHQCPQGEDGYCYGAAPEEGEGDGDGTGEGALDGEGGNEGEGAEEGEGTADGEGSAEGVVEGDGEGDPIEQFTLTYRADTGGRIEGLTEQTVAPGGDGVAVQVLSYTGFSFIEWSDGSTDNPRWDIQVTGGIDVTAIFLHTPDMIPVPAGDFLMGTESLQGSYHRPVHTVTLSAYEIGKYEVTNEQYGQFLNWALDPERQWLRTEEDEPWVESSDIYAGETLTLIYQFSPDWREYSDIQFENGRFLTRHREGLPQGTLHPTANLPVVQVSWHGAALYANYLSLVNGLEPVYNTETWEADFSKSGFHLPTEAQWERAAAWDGTQHYAYGYSSNSLPGPDTMNFTESSSGEINPLGLVERPNSSPVGWFNGVNVSPNGNVPTKLSVSPLGAFDMSGNAYEMCHDWHEEDYYSTGGPPWVDPIGPPESIFTSRVLRGGSWGASYEQCDTANRSIRLILIQQPTNITYGFRLAR